jgi:hypothetical protein
MTIKDDAYRFYKKIWDSPNREEIYRVVVKLKSSTRGHGNKIYPAPMLGLLLYNQQALKSFHGKSAVEELEAWDERELKILFGVHNQVRRLNELCIAPLVAELPQVINAVNPYKAYPYPVSTDGFEDLLFTQEDAKEIIQSFHTHPAFNVAISNMEAAKKRPLDYDQTIWRLNSEIVEAGPGGTPQWITNYEEAERYDHPEIGIFFHVGALLSLQSSLANLNQFVYHGLFQNELIKIDRSLIIDYLWTMGGAGPSMWIMHIPYGYMYIFEPTDLILVNVDKPREKGGLGDRLCSIHTQITPGTTVVPGILKVRMIDSNLNAYGYLLPRSNR